MTIIRPRFEPGAGRWSLPHVHQSEGALCRSPLPWEASECASHMLQLDSFGVQ
jgi:hypothetical protein